MLGRLRQVSLLWKILFSTSVAITALFALTGWIVQNQAARLTSDSLAQEVRTSLAAYESLWRARAEMFSTISLVLSRMPDVRAAFSTGDRATIRDTAGEIWSRISRQDAMFYVTDPQGATIAALGTPEGELILEFPEVSRAAPRFPAQASGFAMHSGRLFEIAITPVYVESAAGPALINVLVAGSAVDADLAERLKQATGGSEFVFTSGGRVIASTLPGGAASLDQSASAHIATPLVSPDGQPVGELRIYRSFDALRQHIRTLRRDILLIWMGSVLLGLLPTYLLARRLLKPVRELDLAAAEIARGNYDQHIAAASGDELGRLAATFNGMCASIRSARQELIRQERISTIGRLSTSLVHDLRNPLAAIYGGAEMLVDSALSPPQIKRLAANIYQSSRRVQEMLQALTTVSRGGRENREVCRLAEIAGAALEAHAHAAAAQAVECRVEVPDVIEIVAERSRMERVFTNLIGNALEAMPEGGKLSITARTDAGSALVVVEDTGPGVAPEIIPRLFQPFVTSGKKNGLGLGLAMSRQTVIDHGGDIRVQPHEGIGARFCVRLPLAEGMRSEG